MKHKSTALESSSVQDIRGIIFCQRSPIESSHTMESCHDVQAAHISQVNGNRSMVVDFDNCDSNESILDGLHQRRANPRLISPLAVPSASIVSESEITSPMVASEHSKDEQPLSGEFFASKDKQPLSGEFFASKDEQPLSGEFFASKDEQPLSGEFFTSKDEQPLSGEFFASKDEQPLSGEFFASKDEQPLSGEFFANDAVKEFPQEINKPETISTAHLTLIDLESVFGERMNKVNLFYTFITILRTKATAAQNVDALSDHIVRGLYFQAVVFVATIYDARAVGTVM